jgi:hypothetical protein
MRMGQRACAHGSAHIFHRTSRLVEIRIHTSVFTPFWKCFDEVAKCSAFFLIKHVLAKNL